MKLSKAEIWVAAISLAFVVFTAGVFVGGRDAAPLTVSVEKHDSVLPPEESTAPEENGGLPTEKVNINTAGVEELTALHGIGEAIARRIIEYREANGPFADIGEICSVSGIGPKKFEDIKDFITVS